MQRICTVPGGVNAYLSDPHRLLTEEVRRCPFCADHHRLRRHGHYRRWAVFPGPDLSLLIPILRLLCHATGRTVSLLPDFCLPRRQYGPAILGIFLDALARLRLPVLTAFCAAVPGSTARSSAQHLRDAFLRHAHHVRSFLYGIRHRHIPAPPGTPAPLRELASLVHGLTGPSPCPGAAFVLRSAPFHTRFHLGFA